ncbi:hypothetical protein HOY82DRAFT_563563 [Tuber indicum]|nr:hypothetical protein HOY82DRAFT_563563 [Tuber indicum]
MYIIIIVLLIYLNPLPAERILSPLPLCSTLIPHHIQLVFEKSIHPIPRIRGVNRSAVMIIHPLIPFGFLAFSHSPPPFSQ